VSENAVVAVVHAGQAPVNVCVDGQEDFSHFRPNDIAYVLADPRRFRLVTFPDVSFYDRFRQRFNDRLRQISPRRRRAALASRPRGQIAPVGAAPRSSGVTVQQQSVAGCESAS
jgi:hypothetical protein